MSRSARRRRASPHPDPGGIRNLVVVSDLHVGCRLGLCHPEGAALDDGGRYEPSRLQRVVWAWWEEFWTRWVPEVTHGEPYAVVINGDAIEGVHHRATTPWSHHLGDQTRHCLEILRPIAARAQGRIYLIRGTEAHVGISAAEEERMGRELGAIPDDQGQTARWELWIRIGGQLCHFLHHIGTTSSGQHESSAVNAEMAAMFLDAGTWTNEPPRVIVRSHRHRMIEVRRPAQHGQTIVCVTPGWQLKTPFAWKVAGARVTQPQIGGIVIRAHDGEVYTRHYVRSLARTPEVTLS